MIQSETQNREFCDLLHLYYYIISTLPQSSEHCVLTTKERERERVYRRVFSVGTMYYKGQPQIKLLMFYSHSS